MNFGNLELIRFINRLFLTILTRFVIIRAGKTYSKLKMALSAAVKAASSSRLGASSRFSPNSIRRSSRDLRIEICSQPMESPLNSTSSSGRFATLSHLRPTLNHNCRSFAQMNDKLSATHDNEKSSVKIQKERERLDDSERNLSSGVVDASKRPVLPLKRRIPPSLEIPLSSKSVAPSLHEEMQKEMYVQGCNYTVACKKGRREVLEDAYKAMPDLFGDSKQAFFGVFDGHGGREAADFAAEKLGQNIVDELGKGDGEMEKAFRTGYLTTDEAFSKQNISSGACCVTALIKEGEMVVANAGDCRAVVSIDGIAEALTCDHRVEREDERRRIENLGGYVDCRNGVWRAQGVLAVSRSIGDIYMKQWISAEPETMKLNITSNCEFLILASDGLWDKVSNEEAVDMARPFWVEKEKSWGGACRKLVEVAVSRGSKDDVTVMIVDLSHFSR